MSGENRGPPEGEATARVKVVDRRRFREDGEPVEAAAGEEGPAAASAGEQAELAEARRRISEQAARIDELARAYAAVLEDNKAFRARLEREKERVVESERVRVAQALLDAADELARALAAVPAPEPGGVLANLAQGVGLTLAGLERRIAELGAERISLVGQPFDPRLAEAVDAMAVADASQDGMVLQEVRAGYRVGDRVLRPARVLVGRLQRA